MARMTFGDGKVRIFLRATELPMYKEGLQDGRSLDSKALLYEEFPPNETGDTQIVIYEKDIPTGHPLWILISLYKEN